MEINFSSFNTSGHLASNTILLTKHPSKSKSLKNIESNEKAPPV
jgi:hypothetical protein